MSPRAAIREAIMCPLVKCYPAPKPKKHHNTPQGLERLVWTNRAKTRQYFAQV